MFLDLGVSSSVSIMDYLVLSFLEEAVNVVALESADEFALEALVTELLNW